MDEELAVDGVPVCNVAEVLEEIRVLERGIGDKVDELVFSVGLEEVGELFGIGFGGGRGGGGFL